MAGLINRLKWLCFDKIITPWNLFSLRKKKKIRVLFVISELANWKTERLYLRMKEHPQFKPILGVIPTLADNPDHYEQLINHCKVNGYQFIEIAKDQTLTNQTKADIIIYQQPYLWIYYPQHRMAKNLSALFIYIPYYIHSVIEEWTLNLPILTHAWQFYFENEDTADEFRCRMINHGKNISVTGVPIMDDFLDNSKHNENPWKNQKPKKRIIYAPHHTINPKENPNLKGINYATILEYGDFMLEMAEKYKNEVHFAFKPHPYLKQKLYLIWGKERTDEFYEKWNEMENSQLESGQYIGLFRHSDAMIHDCSSFTIEYFYAHRPVMYLVKDKHHADNCTKMLKEAFRLHYHGHNKQEIEQFILNVINGIDQMKDEREVFFKNYLVPPARNAACDNIINSILKMKRYHNS